MRAAITGDVDLTIEIAARVFADHQGADWATEILSMCSGVPGVNAGEVAEILLMAAPTDSA